MPQEHNSGDGIILQAKGLRGTLRFEDFERRRWHGSEGYVEHVGGRGGSCLIEVEGRKAVLRQYHRGGFVGNLLSNQYLWLGRTRSRPWREWKVLERAVAAGLPVPEPLAACIWHHGFWYRAALMTAYLEDTEMLTQRLRRVELGAEGWHLLGSLIKRLHDTGIRHADLTSDNVLIDSRDRFYLIDFDQARLMQRLDDWQWQPLYRFQRSIEKRDRRRRLNFRKADWQALMDGYQS